MAPLIKAPVAEFNGIVGGVQFANGEAETDNAAVIAYCEAAGYTVEHAPEPEPEGNPEKAPEPEKTPAPEPEKAPDTEVKPAGRRNAKTTE